MRPAVRVLFLGAALAVIPAAIALLGRLFGFGGSLSGSLNYLFMLTGSGAVAALVFGLGRTYLATRTMFDMWIWWSVAMLILFICASALGSFTRGEVVRLPPDLWALVGLAVGLGAGCGAIEVFCQRSLKRASRPPSNELE